MNSFVMQLETLLSVISFALAMGSIWVAWRWRKEAALRRLRLQARQKGVEPLAAALLESIASWAAARADEILEEEDVFDLCANAHLRSILEQGEDPRETAKDLAMLKRQLKFPGDAKQPAFLSRLILSGSHGDGASEAFLVGVEPDQYEVVLGKGFHGLRRGAILEMVFKDGEKMAGIAAVVRGVEEKGNYSLVTLASPERGGFRKREHFRVDTKISATLLLQTESEEGGFRVLSCELVNLSGGGGRLRLGFSLSEGDKICISFPLGEKEKPLGAEARVVWAKENENGEKLAGFEFADMDAEEWRRLLLFLFNKQSEKVRKTQLGRA